MVNIRTQVRYNIISLGNLVYQRSFLTESVRRDKMLWKTLWKSYYLCTYSVYTNICNK